MMVWGLLRTVGLRGLAGVLGFWLHPAGRAVIVAVLALGGWVAVKAYWIGEGRERERAAAVAAMRQAEAAADTERVAIIEENAAAAQRDADDLAAVETWEREVRDAHKSEAGDGVLWRADDGWLRSKSAAGKGGRRSGAAPLSASRGGR